MSAHPITWHAWYQRAAASAEHTLRARIEQQHPSALLGAESWSLTPAGAALRRYAVTQTLASCELQTCVWCGRTIRPGESVTMLGGRRIHDRPCLGQLDVAMGDTDSSGRKC